MHIRVVQCVIREVRFNQTPIQAKHWHKAVQPIVPSGAIPSVLGRVSALVIVPAFIHARVLVLEQLCLQYKLYSRRRSWGELRPRVEAAEQKVRLVFHLDYKLLEPSTNVGQSFSKTTQIQTKSNRHRQNYAHSQTLTRISPFKLIIVIFLIHF